MTEPLHTVSYGGGLQSTALLALAAMGRLPTFDTFLFANTGDDSEHPETLAYVREIAQPFAAQHGLRVVEVQRQRRDGSLETILERIDRTAKSEVIPLRSSADGPPLSRSCTMDFKVRTLGRWLTENGATEETPAHVAVGISADEAHRANRQPQPYERILYPLLGAFPDDPGCCRPPADWRIRRNDCPRIIQEAGLPVPPKSACWFCPFHSFNGWVELRASRPDLFDAACDLEAKITAKVGAPRYLTRYGKPLAQAVPDDVAMLPFDDEDGSCMSGACGT